jgi:hypothetical protein
LADESTE